MTFVIKCTHPTDQTPMYWQTWDGVLHNYTTKPKLAYRFPDEIQAKRIAQNIRLQFKVLPFHTALSEHHGARK